MYIGRYIISRNDGMPLSQNEIIAETKEDLINYLKADTYSNWEDWEIDIDPDKDDCEGWQILEISLVK